MKGIMETITLQSITQQALPIMPWLLAYITCYNIWYVGCKGIPLNHVVCLLTMWYAFLTMWYAFSD